MTFTALKISGWLLCATLGLSAFLRLPDASESHLEPILVTAQAVITVPETIPVVSTTIPIVKTCVEYVADAITAGWPAGEAAQISKIMFRESRCEPDALNADDSNGGSRGLFQMNGIHEQWLIDEGFITKLDDLYDPDVNIRAALHLWRMVGWSAWRTTAYD